MPNSHAASAAKSILAGVDDLIDSELGLNEIGETRPISKERSFNLLLALREALGGHLSAGYAVTGLARQGERAWYVLERSADQAQGA